jgi:hypothetical protein
MTKPVSSGARFVGVPVGEDVGVDVLVGVAGVVAIVVGRGVAAGIFGGKMTGVAVAVIVGVRGVVPCNTIEGDRFGFWGFSTLIENLCFAVLEEVAYSTTARPESSVVTLA